MWGLEGRSAAGSSSSDSEIDPGLPAVDDFDGVVLVVSNGAEADIQKLIKAMLKGIRKLLEAHAAAVRPPALVVGSRVDRNRRLARRRAMVTGGREGGRVSGVVLVVVGLCRVILLGGVSRAGGEL